MAAREFYDAVLRALRQRQQFFVAGVTAHPLYKHSVLGRAASATNLSRLNLILAAMTVVLVIGVFAIGFESGIWLLNFLVTMVLPLISTFRELCGSDTTAQRGWLLFWGVGASLTCFFHFTTLFTKWGGSTVSLIRFVCLALLQLPELNLKTIIERRVVVPLHKRVYPQMHSQGEPSSFPSNFDADAGRSDLGDAEAAPGLPKAEDQP